MMSGLNIQNRDINILHELFVSQSAVVPYLAQLYFNESNEAAKKRLQKLKRAGYIGERPRRITELAKLCLTEKGFNVLKERNLLARYPHLSLKTFNRRNRLSNFTEHHELAVMDVKVAFVTSIQPPSEVIDFSTWPKLHQFVVSHPRTRQRKTIAPDGFIHVTSDDSHHFFYLEVDRSTESLDVLLNKALGYSGHYASGGFAASRAALREANKEHPFRVLFVVKSKARQENIAGHLLKSSIFTLVWIAVMEDVLKDPFGEIWIRPMDMRQPHKANDRSHTREAVIETPVPKHRLFENN